jgi:hypothetical protein
VRPMEALTIETDCDALGVWTHRFMLDADGSGGSIAATVVQRPWPESRL